LFVAAARGVAVVVVAVVVVGEQGAVDPDGGPILFQHWQLELVHLAVPVLPPGQQVRGQRVKRAAFVDVVLVRPRGIYRETEREKRERREIK
jgi:hypothetical protein